MNQPQQMNLGGMGGPVGGAPVQHQMNAGTPSSTGNMTDSNDPSKRLNTYIYDYFLRTQQYDVARVMLQSEQLGIYTADKHSPNQRQTNGVEDMDADRPKDLPDASIKTEGPFLQDWWFQFWDMFQARRTQSAKPSTLNYIAAQRGAQKQRGNMMGGMDPMQQNMRNMAMMNHGMMPNDLKKAAMQNSGNLNPQQIAHMQQMRQRGQQQMMQGQQMERSGSQMDMSGPRSNSPGSGDAPSPKRQRLEGNMQMAQRPGAQGQIPNPQVGPEYPSSLDPAAANRTRELLEVHGVDMADMPHDQFVSLALQPTNSQRKSVEVYSQQIHQSMKQAMTNSNMNKGMPPNAVAAAMAPGAAQGSPMSQAQIDGAMAEYGPNGMRPNMVPNPAVAAGTNGTNGNHALQDYQMQLMLLEQQNKKRLLMARQEQDSMSHPGMPPNNGQFAPNMSPQGSRAGGPSPNPNDMARGTPKMPSPNGQMAGRASPAPGFNPNQGMPPNMRGPMVMQNGQMNPRSHPQFANSQLTTEQLEQFNRQTGGQMMTNGSFGPGGPQQMPPGMMSSHMNPNMQQPGQGPPNMTPRQGNAAMPPPPAPQQNATGGTQPSSPAPAAPPTPSQANKPKPGGKKDAKSNKKNNNNKKNSNQPGATPVSESEQPPTPTPATPITPHNKNAFHQNQQNIPNGGAPPQQSQQQNAVQPPPSQDMPFGNGLDQDNFNMSMDFADLGNGGDVLDNFDFDSFLNTEDPGMNFDGGFGFGDGGLEAGGDGLPQ